MKTVVRTLLILVAINSLVAVKALADDTHLRNLQNCISPLKGALHASKLDFQIQYLDESTFFHREGSKPGPFSYTLYTSKWGNRIDENGNCGLKSSAAKNGREFLKAQLTAAAAAASKSGDRSAKNRVIDAYYGCLKFSNELSAGDVSMIKSWEAPKMPIRSTTPPQEGPLMPDPESGDLTPEATP